MAELNAMATDPDSSHVFTVTNFNSLNTIKGTLAQKTCEGIVSFYQKEIVYIIYNATTRFYRIHTHLFTKIEILLNE